MCVPLRKQKILPAGNCTIWPKRFIIVKWIFCHFKRIAGAPVLGKGMVISMQNKEDVAGGTSLAVFEYLEMLIFAAVTVVLLCTFVFRMVRVDGWSMFPTLTDGDFLVSTHMFYEPQKGDIVVITKPNEISSPLIKRVIATGGDTVDIDFERGEVTVNGKLLEEDYINDLTHYQPPQGLDYPLTVPEGEVFAMGDNRNESSDSRDAHIGLIDTRYIMGKTIFRLLPVDNIGPIGHSAGGTFAGV